MPGELGYDTGPFVNVAAFCEKALVERDGSLSLIRVIDHYMVAQVGPEAPEQLPENTIIQTTLALVLKPGEARGTFPLRVDIEDPSGQVRPGPQLSVSFTGGPNNGVNVVLPIGITIRDTGLHWASVWLNDRVITRVPMMITYQYMRGPIGPPMS